MGKEKKELYCPHCKKYPNNIVERYLDPIEEKRIWNGELYELQESNIDRVKFEQFCGTCSTKLEYKG